MFTIFYNYIYLKKNTKNTNFYKFVNYPRIEQLRISFEKQLLTNVTR